LPNIDFSQVGDTSANTIRKSLDESQFVIKYDVEPSFIKDQTVIPVQTLTHEGALILMASDQWSLPIETNESPVGNESNDAHETNDDVQTGGMTSNK